MAYLGESEIFASSSRFLCGDSPGQDDLELLDEAGPESTGAIKKNRRLAVVIDDEPLVLKGLALVLEQLGWTVVAGESVEEALDHLIDQGQRPSLIIADYRLRAGRTGVEAILSIRGVCGCDIPAFLLTGDTYPDRLREAFSSGFTLLHKPISFRELNSQLLAMAAD